MSCTRIPFCSICASSTGIEALAHGGIRALLGASLVSPLAGGVNVAVVSRDPKALLPPPREVLALANSRLIAVWASVKCGHRLVGIVHSLYDVIFAPMRPEVVLVFTVHPQRRPNATSGWQVVQSNDEEPLIVGGLGLDTDGWASSASDFCLHVCTNVNAIRCCTYEVCFQCRREVDILHEPLCWVRRRPECPLREEIARHIRFAEGIFGRHYLGTTQGAQRLHHHPPHLHRAGVSA
mmetsp:Transcript_118089/g.345884  ORF Transcript_118089/g.345884 Transcript_118089/m.345884 type:complete len:237 (-) Transcript_118089:87-797(-)